MFVPLAFIWLSGLGVWFSLWVREVPGSNPGWALIFCSPGKNTTFRGHTDLNHISPINLDLIHFGYFCGAQVYMPPNCTIDLATCLWVKSHQLLSGARAPLGPRRDAGVSKGPAEGPSFFCPGGRKIFLNPERRPSESSNLQNFAIFETLDFQNIGPFTHLPSTLCNKASEIHIWPNCKRRREKTEWKESAIHLRWGKASILQKHSNMEISFKERKQCGLNRDQFQIFSRINW